MRYCNKCKVVIENNLSNCPLCKQRTIKRSNIAEKDFPIQRIMKEDLIKKIMRILVFLFIILIGTNIVLNVAFSFNFIWAPYSIVVLFYAYLLMKAAIKSYKNVGTIVMINVYMLSIIGFILDLILGYAGWSIDFLIPILISAGIIVLVIFILIKPANLLTYFMHMLIIALFGITLLILLWADIVTERRPSIITAAVSLIVIIGMFMFGDKKVKNEFAKRFHY
ncbi:MAG: DUF6320 domain-containing protein [Bacilli bacterium]|nr:DUF6320 domain-containing protein [Bacilli bacterium]